MADPSRASLKPKASSAVSARVPRDVEDLLGLSHQEVEQLAAVTQLRLSHLHHKRSGLLGGESENTAALAKLGAQIKAAGNLLSTLLLRRGQLRSQRRRELGRMPERNAAIAMAVDSRLSGRAWRQVHNEAERILSVATADLKHTNANEVNP